MAFLGTSGVCNVLQNKKIKKKRLSSLILSSQGFAAISVLLHSFTTLDVEMLIILESNDLKNHHGFYFADDLHERRVPWGPRTHKVIVSFYHTWRTMSAIRKE